MRPGRQKKGGRLAFSAGVCSSLSLSLSLPLPPSLPPRSQYLISFRPAASASSRNNLVCSPLAARDWISIDTDVE